MPTKQKPRVEWVCPKCGANANQHGKGGTSKCIDRQDNCLGFICDCDLIEAPSSDDAEHGHSYDHPCPCANCYHCG